MPLIYPAADWVTKIFIYFSKSCNQHLNFGIYIIKKTNLKYFELLFFMFYDKEMNN